MKVIFIKNEIADMLIEKVTSMGIKANKANISYIYSELTAEVFYEEIEQEATIDKE